MGIIFSLSYIICGIVSFTLSLGYNSSIQWQRELNSLLENRLYYGKISILEYGISLFGRNDIVWIGGGLDSHGNRATDAYNYVDSFYIQLFQRYGVIVAVVILLLLTIAIYQLWKHKDYYMVFILAMTAAHGIVDDLILYLYYNTFWFAICVVLIRSGHSVYDRYEKKKRSKHLYGSGTDRRKNI